MICGKLFLKYFAKRITYCNFAFRKLHRMQTNHWYILKTIHKSELKLAGLLEQSNIQYFLPMTYKITTKNKKKVKTLKPAISDIVFVYSDKDTLQSFKDRILITHNLPSYFLIDATSGKRVIATVPDKQMTDFIIVCSSCNEHITFHDPNEITLQRGTRIRIIGGSLNGVEATLIKTKYRYKKELLLQIPNLAITIKNISPDLIEIIG